MREGIWGEKGKEGKGTVESGELAIK